MKKLALLAALVGAALVLSFHSRAQSHCEIPCGIYNDDMRFHMMEEHIATLEKSMAQINDLSKAGDKNYNQIVRWVMNKDEHADAYTEIVTQYFLAQRVKPEEGAKPETRDAYLAKLALLHEMIVTTMKCKQTTDTANTAKLAQLTADFEKAYTGEKK